MSEAPDYEEDTDQMIIAACPQCGREMKAYPWVVSDGRTGYCRECDELVGWEET